MSGSPRRRQRPRGPARGCSPRLRPPAPPQVRSELDDVNTIISPPRGRVAAELVKAPYVRHMVRYDRATQDYDQGPGSGRLVHYAVAGGQRALVAAYLAEGGDPQARTNPAIASESLPNGVSGLHDASLTLVRAGRAREARTPVPAAPRFNPAPRPAPSPRCRPPWRCGAGSTTCCRTCWRRAPRCWWAAAGSAPATSPPTRHRCLA